MFTEAQKRMIQTLSMIEQNEATIFDAWDDVEFDVLRKDLLKISDYVRKMDIPYFAEIFSLAERNIVDYYEHRLKIEEERQEDEFDLDDYEVNEDFDEDDEDLYDDDEDFDY